MKASLKNLLVGVLLVFFVVSPVVMAKDEPVERYPDATREAPEVDLRSQRVADKLNEGLAAVNAGDTEKALATLKPMSTEADSKYARAMALQGLANLHYNQGDITTAIAEMKQALEIGVMPNDTYFDLMYGLAQFYMSDEQYDKAFSTLQTWRAEGKRESARSYALEGNIDYRLGNYEAAVAAINKAIELNKAEGKTSHPGTWDQIMAASYAELGQTDEALVLARKRLAANPDDMTTLHNTVSLLIRAQRYDEAATLMEGAKARGALTEPRDYMDIAKLYVMMAQNSDEPAPLAKKAWTSIDEALAAGNLQPGLDVYELQGNAALVGGDLEKALAFYKKAGEFVTDGSIDVRRGQIFANLGKNAEAIKAIKAGIAKGVDKPGQAYIVLGAANGNAGNRSAAIKAMRKAAEYPATRDQANRWLKEAGAN